jgi:hypothetical protein
MFMKQMPALILGKKDLEPDWLMNERITVNFQKLQSVTLLYSNKERRTYIVLEYPSR